LIKSSEYHNLLQRTTSFYPSARPQWPAEALCYGLSVPSFLTYCPFVASIATLWTQDFESDWTSFAANWSTQHQKVNFQVMRSKV